ncbi:hypothetical protein GY45DRAFT_1326446 [Cubamyces sp. BRFM 1775]|nr:hypothetical protein GY45DRAFT_1326446 [Cubamyces sp. BRFM 1775]
MVRTREEISYRGVGTCGRAAHRRMCMLKRLKKPFTVRCSDSRPCESAAAYQLLRRSLLSPQYAYKLRSTLDFASLVWMRAHLWS